MHSMDLRSHCLSASDGGAQGMGPRTAYQELDDASERRLSLDAV